MTWCFSPVGRLVFASGILGALAFLAPARAANITWVGPNDGFWDIAGNWNPGLPVAADDVLLGAFDTEIRSGAGYDSILCRHRTPDHQQRIVVGHERIDDRRTDAERRHPWGNRIGDRQRPQHLDRRDADRHGHHHANGWMTISGTDARALTGGHVLANSGTITWTNAAGGNQGLIQTGGGAVPSTTAAPGSTRPAPTSRCATTWAARSRLSTTPAPTPRAVRARPPSASRSTTPPAGLAPACSTSTPARSP